MSRRPPRLRPLDLVERLRWRLPLLIFAFVVVQHLVEVRWLDALGPMSRLLVGVVTYGLIGPLVTWWVLTWIAGHLQHEARIESQMREREHYLASVTTASADAILSVDNAHRIQAWNMGAERMFGWTADEMLGQPIDRLLPPERLAAGEPDFIMRAVAERGFIEQLQTERLTRDGRRIRVELTSARLSDSEGRMIGRASVIRDITERVRAEEEIRQLNRELEARVAQRTRELREALDELGDRNEELQRANAELTELDRLKSEFVSMVSHELRAPLTNINGSVELLMSEPDVPPGQRTMLQIIGEQTQRLTRLVQGILNVSRIEAGRLQLRQEPLDLATLVPRVAQAITAADPRPLHVDLPPAPVVAWGDADRVEEVLTNLIDNAFKYSPPGSPVWVRVHPTDNQVVISVSDQGVGIPPDQLEHVFEKFHRVERGDNRETYGHGLGLYIARGVVQAMGGRIWVESTGGAGSTFSFTLPRAPQPVMPAGASA